MVRQELCLLPIGYASVLRLTEDGDDLIDTSVRHAAGFELSRGTGVIGRDGAKSFFRAGRENMRGNGNATGRGLIGGAGAAAGNGTGFLLRAGRFCSRHRAPP